LNQNKLISVIHEEGLEINEEFFYQDAQEYELLKRDISHNMINYDEIEIPKIIKPKIQK
jgi:hypothetical protein